MDVDFLYFLESIPNITKNEIAQVLIELMDEIRRDKNILPDEIIGFIAEICENNPEEMMDMMLEITEDLKTGKLVKDLEHLLDDYCNQEELCSVCGDTLYYNTYNETNEYFGSICYESYAESFCQNGCKY